MATRRQFLAQMAIASLAAGSVPMVLASNTAAPTQPTARPRKLGVVQTVLGPISGDRMGFTAPHEHVLASSTDFMRLWPEYLGGRSRFTN
ncbi:MAG TPA: hypothetical protein VN901_20795, partial [Candidatus Acidoferrales bacterium]|nr:hypothetical protein [Candidatus Acidoferrales bacterium]